MLPTNKELQKSWASQIVGWILRGGEMPNHVAFIMDGNRRFARRKNEKVIKGHESGFHKLAQVLSWCEMLNIPEVTVYAFSAENFKRSQVRADQLKSNASQKDIKFEYTNQERLVDKTSSRYRKFYMFLGRIRLYFDQFA